LDCSSLRPDLKRGIDVELVERVGKDHGSNVTPFHDQVIPGQKLSKVRHQKLSDIGNRRNSGYGSIDPFIAQMRLGADSVDQENQLFALQIKPEDRTMQLATNRAGIVRPDIVLYGQPGNPSIKRTTINIGKTKPLGELARNRAFP